MSSLTTLATVKAFLNITNTTQDALIPFLIARASDQIQRWTERTFPIVTNINRRINGTGTARIVLPDSPILAVSALQIYGTTVPASSDGIESGYLFDADAITLVGSCGHSPSYDIFPKGYSNVKCSWTAGYQSSQTSFVPTGNVPTLTPTEGGTAITNISVTNVTTGALMTEVGSSPAINQYSFSAGVYTFNASNTGVQVTMAYYYVPASIEQACIELIALKLKSRDNIGVKSKSLAGESITYDDTNMSKPIQGMLQPFRKTWASL